MLKYIKEVCLGMYDDEMLDCMFRVEIISDNLIFGRDD